jgi:hypothetical protein
MPRQSGLRTTYFTPPPLHIGRTTYVAPRQRVVTTLDGSVPPAITRAARQKLVVGNIVTGYPRVASTISTWGDAECRVRTFTGRYFGLVTGVSPDGKAFSFRRIARVDYVCMSFDHDGNLVFPHRWSAGYDSTRIEQGTPPSETEMRQVLNGTDTQQVKYARTRSIKQVLNPHDLPAVLRSEIRRREYAQATARMYERLGILGQNGRSDRYERFGSNAARRNLAKERAQQYALDTRHQLRSAAAYVKEGKFEQVRYEAMFALEHMSASYRAIRDQRVGPVELSRLRDATARAISRLSGHPCHWASCGHLSFSSTHELDIVTSVHHEGNDVLPVFGSVCENCRSDVTDVEFPDGRVYPTSSVVRHYHWDDGVYRTVPQPQVIGSYHSSKRVVGYTQPLVPHVAGKLGWPTLGFELEVELANHNGSRETQALKMRGLVRDKLGTVAAATKYLNFENDGSVGDSGFEAVSGWTDLETHATIMRHVLTTETGKNRWVGKLVSHNASVSCGLHVHISKPASLVHASKVRYFMSAPMFKDVVKAVARRYDAQYARLSGRSGGIGGIDDRDFHKPEKCAGKQVKYMVEHNGYSKSRALRQMTLNADRYEHTNFQNDKTIEFRIFKGTTVYGTFMACLEMTQAVWFYCRDTPASAMSEASFLRYLERNEMMHDTKNLRALLNLKGFAVKVPNVKKGTPVPAEAVEA